MFEDISITASTSLSLVIKFSYTSSSQVLTHIALLETRNNKNMSSHRILLTGANGFVGSHILRQLLPRPNVSVRAVVRSSLKIETVKNDFGSFSNLDFAIVPDITAPNAFHEALSKTDVPFDTVIHTASPFLYKAVSDNREFLNPAVRGTTEILESVKAVAPDVKRVIVTSSFASVGDLANVDAMRGKNYTEEDWNPITWDEAVSTSVKNVWYQASKKFAEVSIVLQLRLDFSTLTLSKKAAWDFIETEKPGFDVVTLCPPMVYGPLEHTVKKTSDLNESTARIYNLFINSKKDAPLPPDALYIYVDPRVSNGPDSQQNHT